MVRNSPGDVRVPSGLAPAQQRFNQRGFRSVRGDFRLEDQLEFAALDGVAQALFNGELEDAVASSSGVNIVSWLRPSAWRETARRRLPRSSASAPRS